MANLNGIRFRFYNGITVGDVNDIINYIVEHGGGGGGDVTKAYVDKQDQAIFTNLSGRLDEKADRKLLDLYITKSDADDRYCLESFAVKLDGRLEVVEDAVTQMAPKVNRALLIPTSVTTNPELVGISGKEQKRVNIGSGLGYDANTNTLYNTGGGGEGGEPLYLHTVEFWYDNSWKIWCRTINAVSSQYADLNAFFRDTRKVVSLFATKPNEPDPHLNSMFLGATGGAGYLMTIGFNGGAITNENITSDKCNNFTDWGVEPLNNVNTMKLAKNRRK